MIWFDQNMLQNVLLTWDGTRMRLYIAQLHTLANKGKSAGCKPKNDTDCGSWGCSIAEAEGVRSRRLIEGSLRCSSVSGVNLSTTSLRSSESGLVVAQLNGAPAVVCSTHRFIGSSRAQDFESHDTLTPSLPEQHENLTFYSDNQWMDTHFLCLANIPYKTNTWRVSDRF